MTQHRVKGEKKIHGVLVPKKQHLKMHIAASSTNMFWYAVDQLSCKLRGFAAFYEQLLAREYKQEYESVDLSKKDSVLHIGCGAYPLTALSLLEHFPVKKIVAIDNNKGRVRLAQQVVREKKLEKLVNIEHGDGRKYPVGSFDVIIVSSCSWPTIQILEHLFHDAKPQCKIVVRGLDSAVDSVTKCIDSHPDVHLSNKIRHHPFPFFEPFGWYTFYLNKK